MNTPSLLPVLVFFIFGILDMLLGAYLLFSKKSSCNWPSTEGLITKSEVKFENLASGENTEIMKCHPDIEYEYNINENRHTASLIPDDAPSFDRLSVQELVDNYSIGDKIEVFYDPNDPEKVSLKSSPSILGYILLISGFAMIVFAVIKIILKFL